MPKNDQSKRKEICEQGNSNDGSVRGRAERLRRALISIFILFHLIAITLWAFPYRSSFIVKCREVIQPYMRLTGLFQTWDMFAPEPVLKNTFIKAVVITQHHHIHVWEYPRMDQLGFGERYRKERYRKFAEGMLIGEDSPLFPDAVMHIARLYNDPADPPEKVIVLKYESEIRPGMDDEGQPEPKPSVAYEDYIDPAGLR